MCTLAAAWQCTCVANVCRTLACPSPCWPAQVLRYFGYFTEAVPESPMEDHRVRKVVVHYYLEDDTMDVDEPKQDNSGIPQVR